MIIYVYTLVVMLLKDRAQYILSSVFCLWRIWFNGCFGNIYVILGAGAGSSLYRTDRLQEPQVVLFSDNHHISPTHTHTINTLIHCICERGIAKKIAL